MIAIYKVVLCIALGYALCFTLSYTQLWSSVISYFAIIIFIVFGWVHLFLFSYHQLTNLWQRVWLFNVKRSIHFVWFVPSTSWFYSRNGCACSIFFYPVHIVLISCLHSMKKIQDGWHFLPSFQQKYNFVIYLKNVYISFKSMKI